MNDNDILQSFIFEGASIRGEIVHLEASFQTIMQQHNYPPLIRQILGELLVVAALLSASIKFKGRVTVQFQGKGKLKLLLAQCNNNLQLRGLAQWQGDLQPEELIEHLRRGVIGIIMDPDVIGGKQYQGIVAWQGKSFADSIEGYFKSSEQVPTRLWLAVDEHKAAGLLLQAMPKEIAREGKIATQEYEWEHITHLTATVTPAELLNLPNETLLRRLYVEEDIRLFAPAAVNFYCTCSTQRSENALKLLGLAEVEQELKDKQTVVVTCEFCNKDFVFDRIAIARIFQQDGGSSSTQLH